MSQKLLIALFCLFAAVDCSQTKQKSDYVRPGPAHHTTKGFQNYPLVSESDSRGFFFYLRRIVDSFSLPAIPPDHQIQEDEAITQLNLLVGENSITWLGHATFLLQIDGLTILTDPFLSDTAGPFSFGGSRRFVPPGINIHNLPEIDIILITHDHYDHLDLKTLRQITNKEKTTVLVPLGLKKYVAELGFSVIRDLDWEEKFAIKEIQFIPIPAVHYSGRGLADKNQTLWCSWTIISRSGNYFFSGDSGYSQQIYRNIGEKYGPFTLSIVPIGAYEPREIQKFAHVDPEEAVKIGKDIHARVIVASHWGTVKLSDESIFNSPLRFRKAALEKGFSDGNIWIMKIGESRVLTE